MNEGRPYLQIWREGYGYLFAKFPFVSFLSVRYKSDGLYCKKKSIEKKVDSKGSRDKY